VGLEDYERSGAANAARILVAVDAVATTNGIACDFVHVKVPAEGIAETTTVKGADLIGMASQNRCGLSILLLGSQATKVVSVSTIPVLVCRERCRSAT
jgi:nucleotide-binding universal stress UspA family protein